MSYAFRNTLVLIVLVLILCGGGSYWVFLHQQGEIEKLNAEIADLSSRLGNMSTLMDQYEAASDRLMEITAKWNSRYKVIPVQDFSGETNAYLNDILNLGAFVKLDVQYSDGQRSDKYGYNVYSLRGEGTFGNLYNFIWYVENRPRLFKIEGVDLRETTLKDETEKVARNGVAFDVQVRAYYSSVANFAKASPFDVGKEFSPNRMNENPFYPLIRMEIPPNLRGLLEIDRAFLQAIMQGTAYVVDGKGKIWVMKEGDEVYLGYLSRIDMEKGQAEFTLNKGGITEKVILRIKSNK